MKRKKTFERDYSTLSKDPATQRKLEENFHFFRLKSKEEQDRSMRKQHHLEYIRKD